MISIKEQYLKKPSPIEKELMLFYSPTDPLAIFDVGSCEGLDSIKYAQLFPRSKIYAFEPVNENFQIIQSNIKQYNCPNILPVKRAVSDKKSTATFYKSSGQPQGLDKDPQWNYGNKSSSLLSPKIHLDIYSWCKFNQQEIVETDTIQNFCQQQGIHQIHLLHLDVQGAEHKVLEGAAGFIQNILIIWMEVAYVELYDQQPLRNDTINYMENKGFLLIKEDDRNYSGDHLYINKVFLDSCGGKTGIAELVKDKPQIFSFRRALKNLYRKILLLKLND